MLPIVILIAVCFSYVPVTLGRYYEYETGDKYDIFRDIMRVCITEDNMFSAFIFINTVLYDSAFFK